MEIACLQQAGFALPVSQRQEKKNLPEVPNLQEVLNLLVEMQML
jgi:hypothetical protein